ncbi:hypothetical protein OV203_45675 [Nannocystis sp. ILAH1]|uniref:hypothetical protein n=1 Tax=unclassified Nannocystis TaxID=2627009 RepID=UPI0022704FBC|nr:MULTISPECIES: hypothetical protein [unclassified Nannocystis]MCY0994500.1 hypothetical protein [Nannocystis sp. ILAH1]MCY1063588.1 hypothetical protein [Nannocystis sp. RBIL2]
MSIPTELAGVQTRFVRAVATQEAWVQQYLAELRLPPGAPLPYHPNLGVSEAEYQQLLHAYEHPIVVEADKRDLEVRIERGALRFSAPEPLAAVDLLTLEAGGRARYGDDVVVDGPERIEGLQGSFGTWSGFAWRHDASSLVSRTIDVLDVELGRVAGRRFLHLARRRGDGTAMTEATELLAWID